MQKKYIVWLTDTERATLTEVVKKLKGSSQKVRRAQILLNGRWGRPAWSDAKIAEAVGCRTKTVENIRERLMMLEFELTRNGKSREHPPRPQLLKGEQAEQAHDRSVLRSVRSGHGVVADPAAGILPHAQARQLAQHRGERVSALTRQCVNDRPKASPERPIRAASGEFPAQVTPVLS